MEKEAGKGPFFLKKCKIIKLSGTDYDSNYESDCESLILNGLLLKACFYTVAVTHC